MKRFSCVCGNEVFFQNSACERCGRLLGFLPDRLVMSALEPAGNNLFRALAADASGGFYRQCDKLSVLNRSATG